MNPAARLCVALLAASVICAWPALGQDQPEPSGIVSLTVTSQPYDPLLPWNKIAEQTLRGNAVVVKGRKLITTADLVKNANLLEVRKFGRYPDFPARAVLVDYDLNLALLEVTDPRFWSDLRPLPLADRPVLLGRFTINRWRANGRFEEGTGEVVDYLVSNSPYGLMEYPILRGTTAMTGLGWAEVLTSQGNVIGLISSHAKGQIEAINSDLLQLLLLAASSPQYTGFAHRGFAWQRLNQTHLREFFELDNSATGVLVRHVFPGGTGSLELRPLDILHTIDGYDIDPEGRIEHPTYGPLLFTMAINQSLAPRIPVVLQRNGQKMRLSLRRSRFASDDYRIPPPLFDQPVDYEVFAGLVLQELTVGYLRAWGNDWRNKAPARLVIEYTLNRLRKSEGAAEKVVIISRVLRDPSNLGYEDVANAIVRETNGHAIASLSDFRKAIRSPIDGYHQIDLMPGQGRGRLIFEDAKLAANNARVRQRYGIPER